MTDKYISSLLGFCRKAGKMIIGAEDLAKKPKACLLILVAQDASPRTLKDVQISARCRVVQSDLTKEEIGKILGRREVAALGVTDENFAEALRKNL